MLSSEFEKLLNVFLMELEKFDDLTSSEVITRSFENSFTGKELGEAPVSQLAEQFVSLRVYKNLESEFITWCRQRLENWFQLKFNALKAVLEHEIKKENAKKMAQEAVRLVREGIEADKKLLDDATFLQELARAGHSLNFKLSWEEYGSESRKYSDAEKRFVEQVLSKAFQHVIRLEDK